MAYNICSSAYGRDKQYRGLYPKDVFKRLYPAIDLSPVRELVSLQRRCAANLNQVAIHANTYGVYPAALQKDYAELWGRVSDVLKQLTAVVEL